MSHEVRALMWNLGLVFIQYIKFSWNLLKEKASYIPVCSDPAAPEVKYYQALSLNQVNQVYLLRYKQRHTLSSSTHRTNNYIHDHSLVIIFISFSIFPKAKWRSLSGDRLNEALLTTMGITARLRNRKKPSSGLGLVQKLRHSAWLTWNWICSDPNSWHLRWQSEGGEAWRPASCLALLPVKSLCSDAHIVVLRNKHGKNGCSLTTYYTQPLFLYFSFFPSQDCVQYTVVPPHCSSPSAVSRIFVSLFVFV